MTTSLYERLAAGGAPECDIEGCHQEPIMRMATLHVCPEHEGVITRSAQTVATSLRDFGKETVFFRDWLAGLCGQRRQLDVGLTSAITSCVMALMALEGYLPMPPNAAPGDWAE